MTIMYLDYRKVAHIQLEEAEKRVMFLVIENAKMEQLFEKKSTH